MPGNWHLLPCKWTKRRQSLSILGIGNKYAWLKSGSATTAPCAGWQRLPRRICRLQLCQNVAVGDTHGGRQQEPRLLQEFSDKMQQQGQSAERHAGGSERAQAFQEPPFVTSGRIDTPFGRHSEAPGPDFLSKYINDTLRCRRPNHYNG